MQAQVQETQKVTNTTFVRVNLDSRGRNWHATCFFVQQNDYSRLVKKPKLQAKRISVKAR